MSKLFEALEAHLALNEKVRIDHSRYERTHMKKARGEGNWAFTDKRIGDVPLDDVVWVRGKLADAAKEAAQKLGTDIVYVMESTEPLEESSAGKAIVQMNQGKKPGDSLVVGKAGTMDERSKILEVTSNTLIYTRSHGSDLHICEIDMRGNKTTIIVDKAALKKVM